MANYWQKQPGSRPITYQVLQYASATIWSTKFGPNINQIRVASQIGGWGTVNNTTADSVVPTSGGGVGMIINGLSTGATLSAGNAQPEYFDVSAGQIFMFSSTSTSTGAVSVTEMA